MQKGNLTAWGPQLEGNQIEAERTGEGGARQEHRGQTIMKEEDVIL